MDINDLSYDWQSSTIVNKNNEDYMQVFAHKNELLYDHLNKTNYIFNILLNEEIIHNFYMFFHSNNYINISYEKFIEIINDFVLFHDIGKISFKFQINKLNNKNFEKKSKQEFFLDNNGFGELFDEFVEEHSLSGAFNFVLKYKSIFNENSIFLLILFFSIFGHHTSLKDFNSNSLNVRLSDNQYYSIIFIALFLDLIDISYLGKFTKSYFQSFLKPIATSDLSNVSYFSFFYNYIYSLLICSDVLSSREYEKSIGTIQNFDEHYFDNRINERIKSKMLTSFYNVDYNREIHNKKFLTNLSNVNDINVLRENMLLESSSNLIKNIRSPNHNKVFFLNLPTGGGKTNTSMKLCLDLLENTEIDRIIYAMPFINIIDQNYEIIKENYGLSESDGEIRKIYSATETIFDNENDEFKSKIILQDSFFNFPVICTTFSTFFDGILRNKKRNKFKISSLTNSVVVLDEIQSLPIKHWIILYYLINELSEIYNIYFIIMSATLPKFEKLKLDYEGTIFKESHPLIENPLDYFNHYLFDRTEVKGDIVEIDINDEEDLKNCLLDNIIYKNFNDGFNKGLIVVNTIKSSKLIYELLNNHNSEFEVDLLNSSLLSHVKQKIIYKINNMGENSKKYILVSTQSIEAGVDVSFDFVIRDLAIIDSIEQVRGRCNRSRELNNKDPKIRGHVYLINLKDNGKDIYKFIYNQEELDSRIPETLNLLNSNIKYDYSDIMEYYEKVSYRINQFENDKELNFKPRNWRSIIFWNKMQYSELQGKNGVYIIDNDENQYSLYIPVRLCILNESLNKEFDFESIDFDSLKEIYDEHADKFIFSFNELVFLRKKEEHSHFNFIEGNFVDGHKLINFFKDYIKSLKDDFYNSNIIKKEFSSILNKFIINITINDENLEQKIYEFENLLYFYILPQEYIGDDEDSIYSLSRGLNQKPLFTELL